MFKMSFEKALHLDMKVGALRSDVKRVENRPLALGVLAGLLDPVKLRKERALAY